MKVFGKEPRKNLSVLYKQPADYRELLHKFNASLIAVGICACAFMGILLTIADYRDKKILKHFFVTPCSPVWMLGANVLCGAVMAILSA